MARVRIDGEVENVAETLRALRRIDPELRKRVPDEIKSYALPMLAELKASYPAELTRGWSRGGRVGYRPGRARSKTSLQFRGTRPRNAPSDSWALLRVRVRDAAVSIADMAASGRSPEGSGMVRSLRRHGRPSRFVWPVVERHAANIEKGIEASFERYAAIVTRELR